MKSRDVQTGAGPIDRALRYDDGKARLDMIPQRALWGLARVYEHGAQKYKKDNWRSGQSWTRCAAALMRHVSRWMIGETYDPESGQHHLLHAAFWCFAIYEWSLIPEMKADDDRYIDPLLAKEHATHTTAEKVAAKRGKK